jgi:uroporphyrinogen-III decarboxylase
LEQCFDINMRRLSASLEIPSDHLPVMQPWFGTGLYANMFGCEYVWRDGSAPAVHYKYHSLDEIVDLPRPDWTKSEIAHLVLDTIKYFKARTGDAVPIVWSDTQSACDTATLILSADEVFISCITEPETTMDFMKKINSVIIEFCRVQADLIGDALIRPGHTIVSHKGFSGMTISDDNLAVASPGVNADFNLVLDEEIGQAMGGVAIHCCGNWAHTLRLLKEHVPSCVAVEAAVDKSFDPNPNVPEEVRDALAGSGIALQARVTGNTEEMLAVVKRLLHPDLKLYVFPFYVDLPTAKRNYAELEKLLSEYYCH